MKNIITIWLYLMVFFSSCNTSSDYERNVTVAKNFSEIEHIFKNDNDTTYVVNFWASTCPPCLKEMPLFEELSNEYSDKNFKTYFVNIDDKKRIDKYVYPFIDKLKLKNKVFCLIDENLTSWTAKINQEWYGALPYTVIYKGNNIKYHFGAFPNHNDLKKAVDAVRGN